MRIISSFGNLGFEPLHVHGENRFCNEELTTAISADMIKAFLFIGRS